MSDPFIKEAKKSSLLVKILLGAVAVAAVAALGVIAFKFISYKETGGIPAGTTFSQVAISYPSQGVQLELNDPLKVEAAAIGSKPFTSMELWINGELLGVQAAPSGGAYPFSTFFSWTPAEEGIYSLIAAAIDADGNKKISAQVVVYVAQTETGIEQVSSDLNGSPSIMPPPPAGGYSPPEGPSDNESQGITGIWKGSTFVLISERRGLLVLWLAPPSHGLDRRDVRSSGRMHGWRTKRVLRFITRSGSEKLTGKSSSLRQSRISFVERAQHAVLSD